MRQGASAVIALELKGTRDGPPGLGAGRAVLAHPYAKSERVCGRAEKRRDAASKKRQRCNRDDRHKEEDQGVLGKPLPLLATQARCSRLESHLNSLQEFLHWKAHLSSPDGCPVDVSSWWNATE